MVGCQWKKVFNPFCAYYIEPAQAQAAQLGISCFNFTSYVKIHLHEGPD